MISCFSSKDDLVKTVWLLIILLLITIPSFSQIQIQNPSLEGSPGEGVVPNPWIICSNSPDTDPNPGEPDTYNFLASNGLTYVGILAYSPNNNYYESFSQRLVCSLAKGALSQISMDLAYMKLDSTMSAGGILIYGGYDVCDTAQLLWKSLDVGTNWHRYTATFIPHEDYNYIIFWPYADQPPYDWSYIVIDNLSPTIQVDNAGRVLASLSNTEINNGDCVQLNAQVANTVPTNVKWSSIPAGFSSNQLNAGTVCPTQNTKYIVTITDTCGLTSTDTVSVKIKQGNLIIPTLFTSASDKFYIKGLPSGSDLIIYNLLGQQLYNVSNYQNDFSVKSLPVSMYFYRLKTSDKEYKGKFEVVRP